MRHRIPPAAVTNPRAHSYLRDARNPRDAGGVSRKKGRNPAHSSLRDRSLHRRGARDRRSDRLLAVSHTGPITMVTTSFYRSPLAVSERVTTLPHRESVDTTEGSVRTQRRRGSYGSVLLGGRWRSPTCALSRAPSGPFAGFVSTERARMWSPWRVVGRHRWRRSRRASESPRPACRIGCARLTSRWKRRGVTNEEFSRQLLGEGLACVVRESSDGRPTASVDRS